MANAAAAANASNLIPTSTPNTGLPSELHNAQHNHPLHPFPPGLTQTSQSQNTPTGLSQHQSLMSQAALENQLHQNLAAHPGLLPPGLMNPAFARAPNPGLFPRPDQLNQLNVPNAANLLRPNYGPEEMQQVSK